MGNFVDFSSWPREQEQSFVVFEQRAQESQTKAWTIAGIISGILFVFMVGIFFGVSPQAAPDYEKSMNMDNLKKKKKKDVDADKPAETKPAAAAPAAEKPAETPPAEKPAAEKPAETPPAEKPAEPAKK